MGNCVRGGASGGRPRLRFRMTGATAVLWHVVWRRSAVWRCGVLRVGFSIMQGARAA